MHRERLAATLRDDGAEVGQVACRRPATLSDYLAIARPDHWFKHVFVVPGVVLALVLQPGPVGLDWGVILLGFVVAALISSANYVVNEWLDARFDAHHPIKSARPAVARELSPVLVALEYALLATVGLLLAWAISPPLLGIAALFLVSGVIYNVEPLRSKDKAYLDVASEAINNPIRLALGWVLVDPTTLPPASLILAYWAGGAFLMSIKRLAEYRTIARSHGAELLARYRPSFAVYDENRLLLQSFLYAQLASFLLAVFLVKYRIEYVLSFPLFALLFTIYFHIGLKLGSTAQTPEKLFRETALIGVVGALVAALVMLSIVDIPGLAILASPNLVGLGSR